MSTISLDVLPDKLESTSVWSFPERGHWATHSSKYRGNWAPQVARNIILLYSQEKDIVLDPMVGGGTTMIETKILKRRGIGFDIHPEVVDLASNACNFDIQCEIYEPQINIGDARYLKEVSDCSIDLIATHPPYMDIVRYGNRDVEGDLSRINNLQEFCEQISLVAKTFWRVLKPGKYCAVLMGDTRRHRYFVPLAFNVMQVFLKTGFILKEDVIKLQHNCSATRYWNAQDKDFLLIVHEHLFVFRKPL